MVTARRGPSQTVGVYSPVAVEAAGPVDVERDRSRRRRSRPRAPGRRAPGTPAGAASSPTSWPAASDSSHFSSSTSQYAWSGSRAGPMAGTSVARLGSQDVAQPALGRHLGRDRAAAVELEPGLVLAQVVEQQPAWPSSATSPVSRSSSRAWNRRLATATRSRTASPPVVGSRLISSTAKPRSLSRRMRARTACRSSGDSSGSTWSSSHSAV